jgi:hypothetical protein
MAFFSLLAWLNCHAIDAWESQTNAAVRHPIFMESCLIGITGVSLAVVFSFGHPREAALLLAGGLSALSLAWLDWRRKWLSPVLLRAAADLALLMPAFVLAAAALLGRGIWLRR